MKPFESPCFFYNLQLRRTSSGEQNRSSILQIVSTLEMAFDPISYTYVPTALRPKSTTAPGKFALRQSSILDRNKSSKPSGVELDIPRLLGGAAADDGSDESSVRGMF